MAEITQTIPSVDEYTVTPSRNNPSTFFEDRETRLSEETTRIPQQNTQAQALNTFASQANSLKSEVNGFRNDAANSNTGAQQAKDTAVSASNAAVAAKTAIDGYVIPTEATYNKDGIDLRVKSLFKRSGYTKEISRESRWQVGTTPNTITDIGGDAINIDGVLYERSASDNLVLPIAPFANGHTDELITDGGITTASSHSKGDIVVTGNELVTNGTFETVADGEVGHDNGDGTVDGWNADIATIEIVNNQLKTTQTSSSLYGTSSIQLDTVIGATYVVSLYFGESTLTNRVRIDGGVYDTYTEGTTPQNNSIFTFEFEAIDTTSVLAIGSLSVGAGLYSIVDNISVTLKDKVYQFTEDANAGENLVTSTKVQKLDFVSRLDVVYLSASGYGSFKGYKDFTDKELNEGGSDLIANRYSDRFTKIGENCYLLDGTTKVTNLQVTGSRLNAGAYHPMFNKMGASRWYGSNTSDLLWYQTYGNITTSVYEQFNFATTTVGYVDKVFGTIASNQSSFHGRPDTKFYDKIYLKGENGLASHSLFYAKDDYVLPRDTFGLSSGSVLKYVRLEVAPGVSEGETYFNRQIRLASGNIFLLDKFDDYQDGVGCVFAFNNNLYRVYAWSNVYNYGIEKNISNVWTKGDYTSELNSTDFFILTKGSSKSKLFEHPQLLTYAENLDSEGIQNPSDWSSEWKSHLASGNVTALIPNLVDDQGNSNLPNGSKTTFKMTSKMKEGYGVLASQDNGVTWLKSGTTDFNDVYTSLTYDYVNNTITFGVAPAVGDLIVADQSSWATPYVQLDPQKITKVTHIHEVVYSGDSYDVESNNLILNQVSGIIQTGNNQVVKSLPITATDNSTGVFDYIDDATNTTPTFVKFDAILTDGSKAQCIYGSSDGVIDKSTIYGRRY